MFVPNRNKFSSALNAPGLPHTPGRGPVTFTLLQSRYRSCGKASGAPQAAGSPPVKALLPSAMACSCCSLPSASGRVPTKLLPLTCSNCSWEGQVDGRLPLSWLLKRYSCCNLGAESAAAHPAGMELLSWLSDASKTWMCVGRLEGKEPVSRFRDTTSVRSSGKAPDAGSTCSLEGVLQ